MTEVWVLTYHGDDSEPEVLGVTATLDGAQKAARGSESEYHGDDAVDLEWLEQPDGDWTTSVVCGSRYIAERFEVAP